MKYTQFKESQQEFIQRHDNFKESEIVTDIEYGSWKFVVKGVMKNNEIIEINLDDETLNKHDYAQFLYIPEWQQIEVYLKSTEGARNCQFTVKGLVIRRKDGTGGMDMVTVLLK